MKKKWNKKKKKKRVIDNIFVHNVAFHIMNDSKDIKENSLKNTHWEIID